MVYQELKVKSVINFLLIFIFINCSSNKIILEDEEVAVLNYIINESNNDIYYKSIVYDVDKPISSYIKSNYLNFDLCVKNIDSFERRITKDEVIFLQNKFKKNEEIRLDKLNKSVTRKKMKFNTIYISKPVLFRNNSMAIYYTSGTYGGDLNLLKKKNREWTHICSKQVWIE